MYRPRGAGSVGWKAELRGVTLGQFPETPDGEIETGRRRAAMVPHLSCLIV